MSQQLVVDNFSALLKNDLAQAATSAVLLPVGIGASLPNLTGGDFIIMTVSENVVPSKETHRLQLKVTGVSGDTITFDPSDEAWPAGSKIQSRLGAAVVNSMILKNVPATDAVDGYMTKEDHAKLTNAAAKNVPATDAADGYFTKEDHVKLTNAAAKNVASTDTADGYMTKEDHAKLSALYSAGRGGLVPYKGNVIDRGRLPTALTAGTTASMSRVSCIAKDTIVAPQPIFPNWYLNGGNATTEASPGAAATITASIEYPAGTFKQLKFSGSVTGTIPDGANLIADADPTIVIPRDAEFWVRIRYQNSAGIITSANASCLPNGQDGYQGAGSTDQTMGGTVSNASTAMYYPAGILAMTTQENAIILGDSIANGSSDTIDNMRGVGMFSRAVMAKMACSNLSVGSDRAMYFVGSNAKRMALAALLNPTRVYCNYGYNDIFFGQTANQLITNIATIAALFAGKKFYQSELTPTQVSSTDFYATVAGQTFNATQANYTKAVNNALRKNLIAGITASISTASYRSAEDANTWLTESGGRTITDAVCTVGSSVLTSASAAFTLDDDFKKVRILGAASAGGNATLIMRYASATTVTMTTDGTTPWNALTAVSAGTAYLQAARSTNDGTHPSDQANRRFTNSGAMAHTLP